MKPKVRNISAIEGITMRKAPRILMCPPKYYGIEYEINPWMSRSRGSHRETADKQWQALYDTLMTPVSGLPDLVFTANAGVIFENRFFSSRFRHPERAKESPHFEAWFQAHGYQVEQFPDDCYHEGASTATSGSASASASACCRSS
jgi:N-dimethylarginine dimethylaminohydrolase